MENLSTFAPPVDIPQEDAPIAEAPEQESPPEPVTETVAPQEEAQEKPPEPEKPKTVPLAALHEAREQTRKFRELAEQREREAAERFAALEAKLNALVNPPKPVPSFEENPAEYLRHQTEEVARKQREIDEAQAEARRQDQEKARERAVVQEVTSRMQMSETEFRVAHPDYDDAVAYLQQVADQNLQVAGIADANERRKIAWEQSLQLTANALSKGQNPAEVAYKFAKNYGYKPKADATKVIETAAKGNSKTQSLGNGKAESAFSLKQLENMDDDEFNTLIADDTKWRKMIRQG